MTFVNAYLTEAEKAEFKSKAILNPINQRYIIEPFKWTVDYEQNVYIFKFINDRENPEINYFVLGWKGTPIPVKLKETWVGKSPRVWELIRFVTPPHFNEQKDEMLNSIKDALKVWAFDGTPNDPLNNTFEVQCNF